MSKHLHIAQLLGKRIRHGDYAFQEFPTDRDLAVEVGASKVTVRKAVQCLIDEGLLIRRPNGRPTIKREEAGARAKRSIALLTVAFPSPVLDRWHRMIAQLAGERDWLVRMVGYSHYGDPLIHQTLEGFDGVFFMPGGEEPPEALAERFRNSSTPVVVLNNDWSAWGVRSLWLAAPTAVQQLLEHLGERGHRRVACLNTQPINKVITRRIEQWQLWMATHGKPAPLVNEPVVPFESSSWRAYHVMKRQLAGQGLGYATALFCVSAGAARGAMRAMYEHGLAVGREFALCAADDDGGETPQWIPSLTAIQEPDARPYLSVCLDWMARKGTDWMGPVLVQPARIPLFIGESTEMRIENT